MYLLVCVIFIFGHFWVIFANFWLNFDYFSRIYVGLVIFRNSWCTSFYRYANSNSNRINLPLCYVIHFFTVLMTNKNGSSMLSKVTLFLLKGHWPKPDPRVATQPRMGAQSGLRFKINRQLIYHAENSISLTNLRLRCWYGRKKMK